mgnify:CR=1 FL=1
MNAAYPFEINVLENGKNLSGSVGWRCPSNIAIVKYWGKYGIQLPKNASISFTLSNAHTDTYIDYSPSTTGGLSISFLFENNENKAFANKIEKYLKSILEFYPILDHLHLDIRSTNSFPHSSGIASSASAMAAISMCVCEIDANISQAPYTDDFIDKASYLSRLGSGSASRSVVPYVAVWGEHTKIPPSTNLFAVAVEDVDEVFYTYHDDILIVSAAEKSVSSTAGHKLMDNNVYAEARYRQANNRITELQEILKAGDVHRFGRLAEDEAMTLHALMMCSDPSYILMEAGTLEMISAIRRYRKSTGAPIYFTLDAGPNIHLLYPESARSEAEKLITDHLLAFTANGRVIRDKVGDGPKKLV